MSQKLPPPAYQTYAANILANLSFRQATLAQRGLAYTIELECWINGKIPSDVEKLGKVLGCAPNEIKSALSEAIRIGEFVVNDGFISSPRLDNYKVHLAERREKQVSGGKKGAAITNRRDIKLSSGYERKVSGESQVDSQVLSIAKSSTEKNQTQSIDKFVHAYERAERKEDNYFRFCNLG